MPRFWSSFFLPATWLGKSLQNTKLVANNFPCETHLPSPPVGDVVRTPSAEVVEAERIKPLGFTSCLQQQEVLGVAVTGGPKASTWAAASAGHKGAHLCPSSRRPSSQRRECLLASGLVNGTRDTLPQQGPV